MKKLLSILAIATLAVGCTKSQEQKTTSAPAKKSDVIEGQLVVKMLDGANEKEKSRVLGQFKKVDVLNREENIYHIQDEILSGNEKMIAERLSKEAGVEFVEPNFRVSLQQDLTQDPYFLRLWGLKNFGQDSPNGIEGVESADIGATVAWKTTKGSRNVKVAVLDTGGYYKHPDLAANVWINQKEKDGIPGEDDDKNGYVDDIHGWDTISDGRDKVYYGQVGDPDPLDDHGHGTHVAGTIGAVGGNGIGLVGVNWDVSIAFVKFLDAFGSGSSVDEYRGLEYILANDFDVVNGSYGGGPDSKLIRSILARGAEKGILFVFAAGNDGSNNDSVDTWPANYKFDNVMSVAATDSRDQIADFSNFGQNNVHIAAPGVNIFSTTPPSEGETGGYATWSGTSMATPHVVGAAALLLAADPSLKKQPLKIRERLMATADFKPQLAAMVASGRLNIARAIANDTSGNLSIGGNWEEIPYVVETPRLPQKRIDNAWEIKVPKAKAIQVHIKFYQVESGFDTAVLYDSSYRPAMNLTNEGVDTWSPIMLGDTAHLKFSNSVVSIGNGPAFANFNSEGVQIDKVRVLK